MKMTQACPNCINNCFVVQNYPFSGYVILTGMVCKTTLQFNQGPKRNKQAYKPQKLQTYTQESAPTKG